MNRRIHAHRDRLFSASIAFVCVALLVLIVSWWREPTVVTRSLGETHHLSEAEEQTIAMIKELNGYLISMTTLMFGGLGWYLTQHRPSPTMWLQTAFFSASALLAVSFWYAAMTYAELTAELGQNLIGLVARESRVLYYVEMEVTACGVAAVLILIIFADTVTRPKGRFPKFEKD
jgi:hypothetical protein